MKAIRIKYFSQKGFTLVEILVVVTIVGILSSFLFSNYVGARQRARDATRKSDLQQIRAAFELYKADTGIYPPLTTGLEGTGWNSTACGGVFQQNSVVYMRKKPCDPTSPTTRNYTYSRPTTVTYTLSTCLENAADGVTAAQGGITADPTCTSGRYYVVTNP
jgi:type II secretion system protein G